MTEEELASDGKPLDYVDDEGVQWVMSACGHRTGGGVKPGQKITLCPNCMFLIRFKRIAIVYLGRMKEEQR